MKKSDDKAIQEFLDKMELLDSEKFQILIKVRELVFEIIPDTKERMMYGGILFSDEEDFGGIFAYKQHVSFEFSEGFRFDDPGKLLEGKGKYRRHLKLRSLEDLENKQLAHFIKQIK